MPATNEKGYDHLLARKADNAPELVDKLAQLLTIELGVAVKSPDVVVRALREAIEKRETAAKIYGKGMAPIPLPTIGVGA